MRKLLVTTSRETVREANVRFSALQIGSGNSHFTREYRNHSLDDDI